MKHRRRPGRAERQQNSQQRAEDYAHRLAAVQREAGRFTAAERTLRALSDCKKASTP